MNEPIFVTSLLGIKVSVFNDRIVYRPFIFAGEKTIPLSQIASVNTAMAGVQKVTVETTGGQRFEMIVRLKDKKQLRDIIFSLLKSK